MEKLEYTGTAPTNSTTSTLFDSTEALPTGFVTSVVDCRYRLAVAHSHAGTIKGYAKDSISGSWVQFYERLMKIPVSTARYQNVSIPTTPFAHFKMEWVNGGTTQTTWAVSHAIVSGQEGDPERSLDIAETVKAPIASATENFAAATSTTHAVYAVPAIWLGQRVRIAAATSNLWIAFGTAVGMEVDRTAVVTGTPPAWTGSAKIGWPVRIDGWIDVTVDPTSTHFSFEADAVGAVTIVTSDYEQSNLPV